MDAALTLTASRCAILVVSKHKLKERASMEEVTIIGVDLAKNLFQLHGAAADGTVVFRKKLSRPQFARFMANHPACEVAMEACPSAHHWAREISRHGHEVRLIAPIYVKPFIKRQKNDRRLPTSPLTVCAKVGPRALQRIISRGFLLTLALHHSRRLLASDLEQGAKM